MLADGKKLFDARASQQRYIMLDKKFCSLSVEEGKLIALSKVCLLLGVSFFFAALKPQVEKTTEVSKIKLIF